MLLATRFFGFRLSLVYYWYCLSVDSGATAGYEWVVLPGETPVNVTHNKLR